MFSADQHISNEFGGREEYDNIIKQTRNMTKIMNQQQRFQKAKSHIIDALKNKQSRPMNYSPQVTQLYYILYFVQSSFIWDWLIFLCSFIFMYLVILDNQSYTQKIAFQSSILVLFVIDTLIDFYCKSFDKFKKKNKYPSFYIWKTILISLMIIDLIIFISLPCYNSRVIRPFRILRAFIPVIFDAQIRKTLVSLILTYKILFVFLVYYVIIIFTFALIGSTTLTFDPFFVDSSNPINFDQYIGNYNHLGYMIYQVYAFATYDFYPDNAILAVQNYEPNYLFFIVFIFLNMFIFVSIPGGLIYSKFRQIRSKYIIVDEIKQQHSLILAFVTLAQNQTNLPIATLIKFLFYFYKKKIRYVEYITSICMKLDDNNNLTIQVNQFMEFSKLLLYNSSMYPPTFQDFQIWIKFRTFVNQAIYLKKIVKHWIFNLITSIIVILSAANTIIHLMNNYKITHTFDTVFVWLFFVELILRMTGLGPQKYFTDRWNLIDTCMILLNIIFLFVTTVAGLDNFVRLFRFFRIAGVFKLIIYSNTFIKKRIQIIEGLKRLFSTFLQIMPIIIKFFFLFAFVFYIFGIIGMEVFYNPQFNEIKDDTTYNMYIQFSNFNTFLHSQHLMMQILTEGGWSYNAYDYCWRYPSYYSLIIAFFILMHMTIVTVIGTLLKGIFWQIYFTVSGMMDEMQQKLHIHMLKQEQNDIKTRQMQQINQKIKNKQTFDPDTIIKREIIQKKLDKQILIKIKNFQYNNNENEKSKRTINRSKILGEMMESANVSAKQLQIQPIKKVNTRHFNRFKVQKKISMTFHEIQDKQEEDFQLQMQQLLNRLIISNKLKYSELIAYPKIFVQYLNTKFKKSSDFLDLSKFNLNNNPLSNEQSMNFHAYELTNLLGIQSTSKERKKMVIQTLLRNRLINQQIAQGISKTQQSLSQFHIDTNGALRKMYLAQTNEDLVNKFQIQYFSDIYGNSFNKINKITLQPVLKFQATLTYCLWNILRYPQINFVDFFNIITHVEDQMSNKLLRKGSLVKFVYKLDHQSDIWFVVDQKINQNTKIRFIKSGLWCQTAEMKNNEPYYSKDIFNWQLKQGTQQNIRKMRDQYIKLFYQSFQTLAFSLIDKKPFFQYNPREYIYDLYMQNFRIDQLDKIKNKQRKSAGSPLRISNIMLIVLSKEDERLDIGQQNLPYKLSQINSKSKQIKDEDYLLNNSATYEKLKNLAAKQQQKIIQSQGLPFSYILNMMKQISDMMKLYSNNFAYQIQSVLNEKDQLFDDSNQQNGIIINLPQVRVHTNEQLN